MEWKHTVSGIDHLLSTASAVSGGNGSTPVAGAMLAQSATVTAAILLGISPVVQVAQKKKQSLAQQPHSVM